MKWILGAFGIGRPGETNPLRPHNKRIFRSLHLNPWDVKFRWGWILCWDGVFWHRAVGVKGDDWDQRSHPYYGPPSGWHEIGPFAYLRWRRRGSLRSDIQFERHMGCNCMHIIWLWFKGHGKVQHKILCSTLKENHD